LATNRIGKECTDLAYGLLETALDLEAQAIETNDVDGAARFDRRALQPASQATSGAHRPLLTELRLPSIARNWKRITEAEAH
jgi:hypothetical protein